MSELKKYYRKSIRLPEYNYSQPGAYFITICTHNRECLFWKIPIGARRAVPNPNPNNPNPNPNIIISNLNDIGQIVADEWIKTARIRNGIKLDEWVVMPNHFHGILIVSDGLGPARRVPTVEQFGKPVAGSLATIIRSFKSAVTNRVNKLCQTPGSKLWQRNYWERIIRNDNELIQIRDYIIQNPEKWQSEYFNSQ